MCCVEPQCFEERRAAARSIKRARRGQRTQREREMRCSFGEASQTPPYVGDKRTRITRLYMHWLWGRWQEQGATGKGGSLVMLFPPARGLLLSFVLLASSPVSCAASASANSSTTASFILLRGGAGRPALYIRLTRRRGAARAPRCAVGIAHPRCSLTLRKKEVGDGEVGMCLCVCVDDLNLNSKVQALPSVGGLCFRAGRRREDAAVRMRACCPSAPQPNPIKHTVCVLLQFVSSIA